MPELDKKYIYSTSPIANKNAVVAGDKYRFTVLTERLIRIELSSDGDFEDRATQFAVNRNLPVPEFSIEENGESLTITT